jgi:hypothetical protein
VNLQELHESAVYGKDMQIESKGVKDAIDLLNKHCKKALWMLHDNNPLWRGHKHSLEDFSTVDTSKSERASTNTRNYYTIILDNNPKMAGWPKRSKSLICSKDLDRAFGYAQHNSSWLYALIPYDDAKIGAVNSEDIWDARVSLGSVTQEIEEWNDFWRYLGAAESIEGLEKIAARVKAGDIHQLDKMLTAEQRQDLMGTIFDAYDPKRLGFTLHNSATVKRAKFGEVWVEGKVMLIKKKMWDRIRASYKELSKAAGQTVEDDE